MVKKEYIKVVAIVTGLVLLIIAFLLIHKKSNYWAPPIDGRLFMGLADRADVGACNAAELVAKRHKCKECKHAARVCMRHPWTGNSCYKALKKCNPETCKNEHVIQKVQRHCGNIRGSPNYPYALKSCPRSSGEVEYYEGTTSPTREPIKPCCCGPDSEDGTCFFATADGCKDFTPTTPCYPSTKCAHHPPPAVGYGDCDFDTCCAI